MSYPDSDVIFVCYSVVHRASFRNVTVSFLSFDFPLLIDCTHKHYQSTFHFSFHLLFLLFILFLFLSFLCFSHSSSLSSSHSSSHSSSLSSSLSSHRPHLRSVGFPKCATIVPMCPSCWWVSRSTSEASWRTQSIIRHCFCLFVYLFGCLFVPLQKKYFSFFLLICFVVVKKA